MGPTEVREFCQTDASGGEGAQGGGAAVAFVCQGVSPGVEAGVILIRTKTSAEEQYERIPALRIHDHRSTSDTGATRCRQYPFQSHRSIIHPRPHRISLG